MSDEIKEDSLILADKFKVDVFDWWIEKAVKRYSKLHKDKKLNGDTLWYDDLDSKSLESWFSSRGIDELL